MRIKLASLFLIAVSASSAVAANTITFYRDGALLQQEAATSKGVTAETLPVQSGSAVLASYRLPIAEERTRREFSIVFPA